MCELVTGACKCETGNSEDLSAPRTALARLHNGSPTAGEKWNTGGNSSWRSAFRCNVGNSKIPKVFADKKKNEFEKSAAPVCIWNRGAGGRGNGKLLPMKLRQRADARRRRLPRGIQPAQYSAGKTGRGANGC